MGLKRFHQNEKYWAVLSYKVNKRGKDIKGRPALLTTA